MRRALLLSWIIGVLVPAAGLSQVVPTSMEVVDSLGNVLGPVVDVVDWSFPQTPVVTFTVASRPVAAAVQRTGLMFTPDMSGTVDPDVYFSSSDCTGLAYIGNWISNTMWEPQAIVGPNNSVYIGTLAPQAINYNSVLRPGTPCAVEAGIRGAAIPATFLQNLTPPFQPPFSVRAAAGEALAVPAVSLPGLVLLALGLGTAAIVLMKMRMGA